MDMLVRLRMAVEEIEMNKVLVPAEGKEALGEDMELENVKGKGLHNLAVEDIGPGDIGSEAGSLVVNS